MIAHQRFRAWLKPEEKMYHVVGLEFLQKIFLEKYPLEDNLRMIIMQGEYEEVRSLPKYVELMMYSTALDKEGKEICQSDIVEVQLGDWAFRSEVFYEDGCFWIKDWDADLPNALLPLCDYATDLIVIGNIYEDSHMLDEGDN